MPEKVLVVDDDVQTLKMVGIILERSGYEVVAARSGKEALDQVTTERPDLVILDVAMPDMDGYEVSRTLRANPDTAELPIILFTARTQIQDKVTGFEVGADHYMTKPAHPEELLSRVRALLTRSARPQPDERSPRRKMIAFLGSKGGVGTSTLAVNVALALVSEPTDPRPVILGELVDGLATAALQLGFSRDGRIAQLLDRPVERIDAELVESQLDQFEAGLLLLTGQSKPRGLADPIPSDYAWAIVQALGALAECVLLDLGTGFNEVNQRILARARQVVVTIEPDTLSLTLASRLLDEMNQSLNIPKHQISLVLINKSRSATSFSKSTIEDMLGHDIMGMVPAAPELAFQATQDQRPIVTKAPDSIVAQQYRTIAADLASILSSR